VARVLRNSIHVGNKRELQKKTKATLKTVGLRISGDGDGDSRDREASHLMGQAGGEQGRSEPKWVVCWACSTWIETWARSSRGPDGLCEMAHVLAGTSRAPSGGRTAKRHAAKESQSAGAVRPQPAGLGILLGVRDWRWQLEGRFARAAPLTQAPKCVAARQAEGGGGEQEEQGRKWSEVREGRRAGKEMRGE
jgi:hypothetical protein